MNKRLTINSAKQINDQLQLIANEPITSLKPAGHMLVDSDHFSFVYLMENEETTYTYILIPEQVWPVLKETMEGNLPVFLTYGEEQVELTEFRAEFAYLISNIKGNGNYGEEMVEKVEKLF